MIRRIPDFATFSRTLAGAPDQRHQTIERNAEVRALDLHVVVTAAAEVAALAAEVEVVVLMIVRIQHHPNVSEFSIFLRIQLKKTCAMFLESLVKSTSAI